MRPVASLYRAKLYKSVQAWVLPATTFIVFVQLLVYCIQLWTNDDHIGTFWASRKVIPQLWRLVTYAFVHGSLMHVISNVAMTLVLSPTLEFIHGPLVVCLVWGFGVIGGAVAHVSANETIAVVGSSAGVYAILVARIYDVFVNMQNMRTWPLQLLTLFCLGLPGLVDWITTDELTTTSHSAHLGGAAFGFAAAIISVKKLKSATEYTWDVWASSDDDTDII